MSDVASQFLQQWHEAVDERSFDKVNALLADNFTLISPVAYNPITDRDYILKVLEGVVTMAKNFRYTRSTVLDDGGVLLLFEGEVDGKTIEGIDLFDLNDQGQAVQLKVMLRPFRVYVRFAYKMAELLGIKSIQLSLLKLLIR